MNRCAKDGYLVGGNTPLPSDPTEFHIAGLHAVPCSRLRCQVCKVLVRNRAGFAFTTPAHVSGADLKKIHETPDWAQSPLLHEGLPEWRLYLCHCSRWLETDNNALSDPSNDGPSDPSMPWACDGHPLAAVPHVFHGVEVRTDDELHDFVVAGCRGTVPPDVRPEDVPGASWLCRLPARLTPPHARVVVETAAECVADPDPVARARALEILTVTRNSAAEQRLLEILDTEPALLVGVPNPISRFDVDNDLAGTVWRVLGPLVATSESIRDRARSMALGGRGNRALYDALCESDSAWLVAHLEDVVRAAPAVGPDMIYSFNDLPKTYMIQPLEDRVNAAMGGEVTLDEAFEKQGPLVGAWDHYSEVLGAYSVAAGAKLLRSAPVALDRRHEWTDKLRSKGIRIGAGFVPSGRVWVLDSQGIALWNRDAQVLSGTRTDLKLSTGSVRFADVANVVCFVSPRGPGYRGVRCELHDGSSVTILDDDADTGFGPYFAADLAKWILVRYVDEATANDERVTASTCGFELQGSDGDETRLLVHPTLGYSIAVPGRPHLIRATGDGPTYDAVLKMSDAPIELGFRMDEVPTKITPEKLVPALLVSYVQMRARDPLAVQTSQLWGKTLCRGIDTGMRANYDLVGDVADAMEFLAITLKPEGDDRVRALHLTARYRKSETTPFAWSNLRAALLYHQSWIPGRLAPTPVWPAASVFAKRSARFELTEGAMAEAVAKAEVLPDIELDQVNRLADVLLEISNQGVPPITPWEPGLTDDVAYKIESCVPASVSSVLMRNRAQIESMHDLRGFLWQCYWAVGNRAELLRRTLRFPSLLGRLPDA